MIRNRRSGLALYLGIALGAPLVSSPVWAADIPLQGMIARDDDIRLFNFTVMTAGLVDVRTYGYAGGVTSTGLMVPGGGFDPILTLFDGMGNFLTDNDEGAGVAVDPSTGLMADARITENLAPGSYMLALTQYDNFASGFNLADGFVQTGHPNFTADPAFTSGDPCAGNMFRDISGTAGRCRDGNWTVDFVNVASAAAVPEPSALLLTSLGLGALLLARRRNRGGATLLLGAAVVGLTAASVQAQDTGPDYSQVSDFLNGKRSVLKITDLQVVSYNLGSGDIYRTSINTSNSQQTNLPQERYAMRAGSAPLKVFSGRMFNQARASNIAIAQYSQFFPPQTVGEFILMIDNPAGLYTPLNQSGRPVRDTTSAISGVTADFTLDGYDELALSLNDGRLLLWTPWNTNDPGAGMRSILTGLDVLADMAAGDFDGNGTREIAGLTVLPTGGLRLGIYSVDPGSLAVTPASSLVLNTPGASAGSSVRAVSMARGRFNNAAHDQLVVAFATNSGPGYVEIIDFAPNTLNPVEKPAGLPAPNVAVGTGSIVVKTGKFSLPGNPYDQIVYMSAIPPPASGGKFFEVLSVDPTTLVVGGNTPVLFDEQPCAHGIQVGNFDNRKPDPLNPGQTNPDLNGQIAFFFGDCGAGAKAINIYGVDPNSHNLNLENSNGLPDLHTDIGNMAFVATDLQGRSMTLGEPTKITISSVLQPSVVIGAPPMHVDFISPDPGRVPPKVINLSAVPEGFSTKYEQEDSVDNKSETENKTSWSFGAKETVSGSFSIGEPEVQGLKVEDTLTAAQELKGEAEKAHGTFQGKTFNLAAETGFGDEITYVDQQFNLWIYPVVGRTVCPAAKPNCQPSEQVPLTIQFSAPSGNPLTQATQGQALEWYQPPWEPGNILSYPANSKQLQTLYPNLRQLTNGVQFLTDSSTITQKTTWAVTKEDSASTSFDQNYSWSNEISETGSMDIAGFAFSESASLELSGSRGLSNLTKSTTSLGRSRGVEVRKPGTFPAFQNYGYVVAPYIMGTTQPGGVVDTPSPSGDVKTFGVVRTMFTADPLSTSAGGWWKQAYNQASDVALSHPSRWDVATPALSNPIPSNCLATGTGSSQMNCAVLQERSPENPWLSPWHHMQGFFISNALSPGEGPQLQTAKAGDKLTLQARVYNYSLKAMPANTEVRVRFYFTPWDETEAAGESVLISEENVPAIPPFTNVETAVPNWVLASTTFDTSKFAQTINGNVSIVFWVVVWMQTPTGQLLPEMPGHGLTQMPGTPKSVADVAEECQPDGSCYGNNVGFYKKIFAITAAERSVSAAAFAATNTIDISKAEVSPRQIVQGGTVIVSASLSAGAMDDSAVSVNFYDGDPKRGGRLFDMERLPGVARNNPHDVKVLYRPKTCGVREVFVVVNAGEKSEIVRRAPPVRVACSASR